MGVPSYTRNISIPVAATAPETASEEPSPNGLGDLRPVTEGMKIRRGSPLTESSLGLLGAGKDYVPPYDTTNTNL